MNLKRLIPLFVCLVLMAAKFLFFSNSLKSARTPNTLNPVRAGYEAKSLKTFSMGYDNFLAALLWVDLLQNAKHTPVTDDSVSWEYAQAAAITTLDPRFEKAYSFSATFLSVFRRDKLGGKLLLEKWVRQDPRAWRPHYLLGNHLYLELHDAEKAGQQILQASLLPNAPQWITSVGIRLLSEEGALLTALKTAVEIYPMIRDREAISRLDNRIRSLNWNLQKQAYETALVDFRKKYHREPSSIQELAPQRRDISSMLEAKEIEDDAQRLLNEKFTFLYSPSKKQIEGKDRALQSLLEKTGVYRPESSEEKK